MTWRDRIGGNWRRWIFVAAAVVIAIGVAHWATNRATPVAPPGAVAGDAALPVVSVSVPGVTSVTFTISFTGAISARYDMPIGSEGEGGRITAVFVEAGDHVERGQVLAKLDDSVLRPQVNRLAASLEESRANAALAEADYRRARGVEAAGALSAEEIERRRAASVTAAAQVKVAEASLAEAQARLYRTSIRAPADGIVLTRTAEVGQIAGSATLFRLAEGGIIEMRGQVAEQDLPRLEVGQPVEVRVTGVTKPFAGRIRLLGAVIDPQTRLGDIRVALDPDPALRPGAFARASATVGHGERPVLPQTAVLSDAQGPYVLIVNGNDVVERRDVRIADTLARGIVIAEGLTGKERVVTTAGGFLRAGERVTVVDGEAARS